MLTQRSSNLPLRIDLLDELLSVLRDKIVFLGIFDLRFLHSPVVEEVVFKQFFRVCPDKDMMDDELLQ